VRVEIVGPDRARMLRRTVLRPFDPPDAALPGDGIADAVHFAALDDDGGVVSTCFVYPDEWPFPDQVPAPVTSGPPGWHLRQMATDPAHRGQGAGSAVLEAVIAYVTERAGMLWCHARVPAMPFYERHGFRAVGEVHPSGEPPIPHRYMYRASP
jgi:GNAT superfamily N-acetyltransferase